MSKYPCKYVSGSKKAELNIEDMATPHLCNALRKLDKEYERAEGQAKMAFLRVSMHQELCSRGGTLDQETGQWTFPPKDTAEDAGDRRYHERKDEGLDPLTGRET